MNEYIRRNFKLRMLGKLQIIEDKYVNLLQKIMEYFRTHHKMINSMSKYLK